MDLSSGPHDGASFVPGSLLLGAIQGTNLSEDEKNFLASHRVSGVTLFRRNLQSYTQIESLTAQIQACRYAGEPPLIIAVDQEGGRVNRLPQPFPNLGPPLELYPGVDAESLDKLYDYGREVGCELLRLGINVNFAPVVDVLTNPENHGIGDRVFGRSPETVIPRAKAYLRGLEATGVKGCLKHFPGQGDAGEDTHHSETTISAERGLLWDRELQPFRQMVSDVALVMAGHGHYPSLDANDAASMSAPILKDLLRQELGFDGVVLSDDMNMSAVPQGDDWSKALIRSLKAGCDLVLVCEGLDRCQRAVAALADAANHQAGMISCLTKSSERVFEFRRSLK